MRKDGIIHEYCPPEQVISEIDKLIALHNLHVKEKIPPEIESAWLHHRFTQIHPFQDGNGRVARCLANLVFIQAEWFPLVITRDDRTKYIEALEEADEGNLSPLISLFSKSQKQSFIRSLGLSEQILSETKQAKVVIASVVIASAVDKLRKNLLASVKERCEKAEKYAEQLFTVSSIRLQEISEEIRISLTNLAIEAQIFPVESPSDGSKSHYYRYQIVETAKQLNYFANLRPYHRWIQLVISLESSTTIILLSFHVLGHEYRGLLVCSACAYHRDDSDEGERNTNDIQTLTDSLFQFSYADDEENMIQRFKDWLEEVVVTGLEYWNNSL